MRNKVKLVVREVPGLDDLVYFEPVQIVDNVKMKKLFLKVCMVQRRNQGCIYNLLLKPQKGHKVRLLSYTKGFFKKLICASQIFSTKPCDL